MWSTWYSRNERSPYARMGHAEVTNRYYEVTHPIDGRKAIETCSLEEAQIFVGKIFRRGEGIATITEVSFDAADPFRLARSQIP